MLAAIFRESYNSSQVNRWMSGAANLPQIFCGGGAPAPKKALNCGFTLFCRDSRFCAKVFWITACNKGFPYLKPSFSKHLSSVEPNKITWHSFSGSVTPNATLAKAGASGESADGKN
jgi:hypothetical protein